MNAGEYGGYSDIFSSIFDYHNANQQKSFLNDAGAFNSYRPEYAQMLQQLMQNPSSITSTPGYQFGMQQAEDQVQHSLASKGLIGGGTMAQTMANTGAQYAGQQLSQQEQFLSYLAGAGIDPASLNNQMTGVNKNKGSALGGLVSGIGAIFGL
jgi:hypothetical protein